MAVEEKAVSTPVFRLYANCLLARGARRSLICDVQRHRLQPIPNGLFVILTQFADMPTNRIKAAFAPEDAPHIDDYFDMLLREGYGFMCDEPERFPSLDLSWDHPAAITNGIIDVDRRSAHDYSSLFAQYDDLGCEALQIRAYDELSVDDLASLLAASAGHRLRHLDLMIKYAPALTVDLLTRLCLEHQWISRILVHSCPTTRVVHLTPHPVSIHFHTAALALACCGQVEAAAFVTDLRHVTEAHHFNSCLNRKLSVCANGEIKSCPSMPIALGHAARDPLAAAVAHPAVRRAGGITKDQVETCRDCEFRYVCTDCRAYVSDPADPYSKPAKCGYDPYSATWAHDAAPA